MNKTSIEWTDYTSNPLFATRKGNARKGHRCLKVSAAWVRCHADLALATTFWYWDGLAANVFPPQRGRGRVARMEGCVQPRQPEVGRARSSLRR
jgi:hypothetical protein